jgi:hypothetical protein
VCGAVAAAQEASSGGNAALAPPSFVAPSVPEDEPLQQARPARNSWYGERLTSADPPLLAPNAPSSPPVGLADLQTISPPAVEPVQMAALSTVTIPRADEVDLSQAVKLPPGVRAGMFQKVTFTGTWLPAHSNESDALGVGELDTSVVLGFPFFRRDTPLLVTPRFEASMLENAAALDLPATLYGASTEFRHMRSFTGTPWAMDLAVAVGYYSDFEISTSEAVRTSGRALAVYEGRRGTKWIVGVVYLNRAGASVLPVAGLIHEPSSDVRWELIFPRPRVAWRLQGSVRADERWFYLGGEFGGGVWSIARRSTGELDELSYRDLRLLVGYERKILGGLSRRFEFGYVFDREVEFDSSAPNVSLDDALFARLSVSY